MPDNAEGAPIVEGAPIAEGAPTAEGDQPPQNPKMKSHADRLTLLRGYLNGSPRSARSPATHSSAKHPASSTLIGVALHAISRVDGASELTGLESRLVNLMSQYATTEELREFG
jgi:hypothetical protein